MPDDPAPESDPLVSLKEADRRRGGCGAFLIAAAVMGVILGVLIVIPMAAGDRVSRALLAEFGGTFMLGAFVLSIAGGIQAARVFTRWRVARMDRNKSGPASP